MSVIDESRNGLEKVVIKEPKGSSAEIFLHGAHVTSWRSSSGQEQIFVSDLAVFQPPKTIRGGIPVCFPQFSDMGPIAQQHGFARNTAFSIKSLETSSVVLSLTPNEEQLKLFPHNFELDVKVEISDGKLTQSLIVFNPGSAPFSFTAALHTYFRVSDISAVQVKGLDGCAYLDNLKKREEFPGSPDPIGFSQEFDRIYRSTPSTVQIVDTASKRTLVVEKEGFSDAVVWNPWVEKAKGMSDFGDEEYKVMVCVEPAVTTPVELGAGQTWTGKQTFSVQ